MNRKNILKNGVLKADIEKLYSTIGKDNFILVLKKLYELEKAAGNDWLYNHYLIRFVHYMSNDMIDEVNKSNLQDDARLCFYMLKYKHVGPADIKLGDKGHFQYESLIDIVHRFEDRNLHYVAQKSDPEYLCTR